MACLAIAGLLFFVQINLASGLSCHPALTVALKGQVQPTGDLLVDDYTYPPSLYQPINATYFNVCVCEVRKCVRKCCAFGKTISVDESGTPKCTASITRFIPEVYSADNINSPRKLAFSNLNFFVVYGNTCKKGRYFLEPETMEQDLFYFLESGSLYMPKSEITMMGMMDFCLDINTSKNDTTVAAACFPEIPIEETTYSYGMMVSIPFLAATFLVYAALPDLQNLHGKSLMSQVAALTTGYLFLIIVEFNVPASNHDFCIASAYIIQLSFLATFFWLNVMSFDIWWTFCGAGAVRAHSNLMKKNSEQKKFMLYSAYAWGCPLIICGITMLLDMTPGIPDYVIKPNFGKNRCWFHTHSATLAYFYGPVAVILICNLLLFLMAAWKIISLYRETAILRKSADSGRSRKDESNRQRFFLYLKLFLVMGVNWIMEVVSWAVEGPKYWWYITDTCNTLQGVLIFWIFVGSTTAGKRVISKVDSRISRRTTKSKTHSNSVQ